LRRDFECVTFTIPPIERNSSHPRIFFADFLLVASAKLAHQKMQSVDNIFEQALPTVIGFPSMPLSSMATVAIFLAVTLPLNAVNDKFSKLDNCIDKSLADTTGLQRSDPKPLP